jgi:hypothetical protein
MKMSKPGLCCDECFGIIASRNVNAAKLWLELCEIRVKREIFALVTKNPQNLRILEILGFVVTTETKNFILVKVNGLRYDRVNIYFCGGRCGSR